MSMQTAIQIIPFTRIGTSLVIAFVGFWTDGEVWTRYIYRNTPYRTNTVV